MEKLAQLLVEDRNGRPEGYSVCIVSEGAMPEGEEMVFAGEKDMYGHAKLGGIGRSVSDAIKELAPSTTTARRST